MSEGEWTRLQEVMEMLKRSRPWIDELMRRKAMAMLESGTTSVEDEYTQEAKPMNGKGKSKKKSKKKKNKEAIGDAPTIQ
ncbi:hypothetical protein OROMI_014256 [Orobanche minor]